ncbi:hypothetical protein [Burkholderia sp. BCC1977]|uniref:hypothetical protein n=1 Tax=Burkholderia sp. BCC1977 TaxID=2817440 RepID=UPI0039F18898
MKPSWYPISSADRMIAPENRQRRSARTSARKVVTRDASHASPALKQVEVVAPLDEAATALAG